MIFSCLSTEWNKDEGGNKWSLTDLRALVRSKADDPQKIISAINSIDRLGGIFVYHLEQAREALKPFFSSDSKVDPVRLVLGGHPYQQSFQLACLVNEANTIALLYTTRSIYDIFAQLLNSLILDNRYSLKQCDIKKVRRALEEGEMKKQLNGLLDSTEFEYVDGFVNTAKHRHLVQQITTLDFESNKVGVKFAGFSYNKYFPALWSDEVLVLALHVKNQIVEAGILLNKQNIFTGGSGDA